MIAILMTLVVGAVIGWLASLIMNTSGQQGTLLNIVVGVIGSVMGSWLFGDVLHIGSAWVGAPYSLFSPLWAVLGACIFIGLLKLVRVLR
ncbi:MAG: GlsB/YeaQ/YmgE family stress response membrane protein [Deltaproteobacteria bacterium]|nr:GlsB/YeaQ/YmgE family stress response membrane protein [Deltaproteobacteria bacterium]